MVSRTTRTRSVHLLVDQVEEFVLSVSGVAFFDPAHGEFHHAAANCFVHEPGEVPFLAAVARKKRCERRGPFLREWKGSIESWADLLCIYT